MRQTHVRKVTNAFLADLASREDRGGALRPRPNVRVVPWYEQVWRAFAMLFVLGLSLATGAAAVALLLRGLS